MAKLYAELTSDKGGRVVGKGGGNWIELKLVNGNIHTHTFVYHGTYVRVLDSQGKEFYNSLDNK